MFETVLLGLYCLIIGLCVGSFLNVVALRAFSEESIVIPPSKCPKCNHKLMWYHNIPLLSYIMLGGKCAFCKCKISIQYPIVECFTGVMFLISYLIFGLSFQTLFSWIFISFLIVMSITDIKETVVFNKHVYSFIAVMYLISLLSYQVKYWWFGLLGIITAFILFELLARIGYLFVNSRLFGEGDTYIAMGIGAIVGPLGLIAVTVLSIIFDVIVMFPMIFVNSVKNKNKDMITGLITALFAVIAGILFSIFGNNLTQFLMYTVLIICIIIPALFAIFLILKDIKNRKEEALMMPPFGPALAVAGVVIYFLIGILRM